MVVTLRIMLLAITFSAASLKAAVLNFDNLVTNNSPAQALQGLIQSQPYLIIKFFKPGCGPCQQSVSVVRALAQQYPAITIVEIDITRYYDLSRPYSITSVPSFIFYQNGTYKGIYRGGGITLATTLQSLVRQYFGL